MTPYQRMATTVVRLVAGGFLVVGGLNLLIYWLKCHREHSSMSLWRCLYLSIPLVIGVAILVKTPALAHRINQYLDDE